MHPHTHTPKLQSPPHGVSLVPIWRGMLRVTPQSFSPDIRNCPETGLRTGRPGVAAPFSRCIFKMPREHYAYTSGKPILKLGSVHFVISGLKVWLALHPSLEVVASTILTMPMNTL